MNLADNPKNYRRLKSLPKRSADGIGVGLQYYNKLEKSILRLSIEILSKLAAFYGILIDKVVHLNRGVIKKVASKHTSPASKLSAKKNRSLRK